MARTKKETEEKVKVVKSTEPFVQNEVMKRDDLVDVKIVNKSTNPLPTYSTNSSAGMDVRAYLGGEGELKFYGALSQIVRHPDKISLIIYPESRVLVPTGIFIGVPEGYEMQCRSRSGFSTKQGVILANGLGTIDADYRGEVFVPLYNCSSKPVVIEDGERISQLVLCKVPKTNWNEVEKLESTERGEGGFGSTGTK